MWANAQRDGCSAESRWCPLFNAAKFGWRPLLYAVQSCCQEVKPVEIWWGAPNYGNETISAASGPKFTLLWGHLEDILLLNNFFPTVDTCLSCEDIPDKVVRWCPDVDFWRPFCFLYFSASRVQHISDLHSKFTLRPHHVWKYGRHPISDHWD